MTENIANAVVNIFKVHEHITHIAYGPKSYSPWVAPAVRILPDEGLEMYTAFDVEEIRPTMLRCWSLGGWPPVGSWKH